MKTSILILISAFLMVGCAGSGGSKGPAGSTGNPVVTGFAKGEKDTLSVQVSDRDPVTRAELSAPDGRTYGAYRIDRDRVTSGSGRVQPDMGVGVGVGVGSGGRVGVGTGVGIGFPLNIGGSAARREPRIDSEALIQVPDMAAYRAGWQRWKVRVYLGEGATARVIEVAAPQPPAG